MRETIDGVAPLAHGKKVVKAFNYNIFPPEILSLFAVLGPVLNESLFRAFYLPVHYPVNLVQDPFFEAAPKSPDLHIIFVHDRIRRVAEGDHRVEAFADLPHLWRNCVGLDPYVQIPVQVEIAV